MIVYVTVKNARRNFMSKDLEEIINPLDEVIKVMQEVLKPTMNEKDYQDLLELYTEFQLLYDKPEHRQTEYAKTQYLKVLDYYYNVNVRGKQ